MRSINTSLIALLPVAGLLVAGVVILGSGTLKDLSLVMLIGMLVGAYSSVFIAVPIAVDLKLRDPLIKAHTQRVTAKRKAEGLIVDADGDPIRRISSAANGSTPAAARVPVAPSNLTPGVAPKPGVKPVRRPAKPAPTGGAGTPAPTAKVGTPAPAPAPAPASSGRPTGKGRRPAGKRSR
jgi:preprotein translocase subunit SecF